MWKSESNECFGNYSIAAWELKLGRCKQVMKSVKVWDYSRSRSFHNNKCSKIIYCKFLLENRWTDFNRTWHAASGTRVLQLMTCLDLDLLNLWQGKHKSPMHLNGGKLLKCHFKGKTCRKWANGQSINDSEKQIDPRDSYPPLWGYILVYYHNIQTCLFIWYIYQISGEYLQDHLVLWFVFSAICLTNYVTSKATFNVDV